MTNRLLNTFGTLLPAKKLNSFCILLLVSLAATNTAQANSDTVVAGAIDVAISANNGQSKKELRSQVKEEQQALAKLERKKLEKLAKKGERLAQVTLGSDFANEAQMLTFAPAAANAALSDALEWYSLAAKRGFPGAPSLDASGVSFYPVRVVRNN